MPLRPERDSTRPGPPDTLLEQILRKNLSNPYPLIAFLFAVVTWGVVSWKTIPRDVFPPIPIPVVMVATFYPGMNATEVERNITSLMERHFTMASDIESIHSRSLNGISIIKVIFSSRIPSSQAVSEISELSLSLLNALPPGTLPPMIVSYSFSNVPICQVLMTSPSLTQARIYDIANNIVRPELGGLPGVSAPPIFGGKVRQISIYLHPDQLTNRKLTPLDVVNAVYDQNLLLPTGNLKIGSTNYFTHFNSQAPDLQAIADIPIHVTNGVPLFVRDVADVKDTYYPQENLVLVDGKPAVVLPIYREAGYSALTVIDEIRNDLPHLSKAHAEIGFRILFDQTLYIKEALGSLSLETFLGILTSALFILLILGDLRQALLGMIALPAAYLTIMVFLRLNNATLNIMTLGGLAISVGPMIDHIVLVIESLKTHEPPPGSPPTDLVAGLKPIATPTIMATLAMITVFFPLFFLSGLIHYLFLPLGISVIGANLISLVLSLTLLPWLVFLAARFFPGLRLPFLSWFPARLEVLFDRYKDTLNRLLDRPYRPVFLISGTLVLLLFVGRSVPVELYPTVDAGQFRIFVHFPSGYRLSESKEESLEIDQIVRNTLPAGSILTIVSNIGIKSGWSAMFNNNSGTDTNVIDIALVPKTQRRFSTTEATRILEPILKSRFPNTIFIFKPSGIVEDLLSRGSMTPVVIEIHGDELQKNMLFAKRLTHQIRSIPGVLSSNVFQRTHYPTLHIEVDRVLASLLGTNEAEVSRNVQISLNSNNQIRPIPWIDPTTGFFYYLSIIYPPVFFQKMEDLANLPVAHAKDGHITYLGELAKISHIENPEEITHDRLERAIDVLIVPTPGHSVAVSNEIQNFLKGVEVPGSMHVRFVGVTKHIRDSFTQLGWGILLAVFFLFLLLLVFYRSFIAPGIVLGVVPLGMVGSLTFLFLTGSSVNMVSIMGILMTIGIVTSNSIILVNRYIEHLRKGMTIRAAVLTGSRERIRPVLITSLSAVAAMIPVSFNWGVGAENSLPLARAVIGGLGLATPLTLFLIPLVFSIVMERFGTIPFPSSGEVRGR